MEAITIDIINAAIKPESPTSSLQQSLEQKLFVLENENKQLKERISYLESIFSSKTK